MRFVTTLLLVGAGLALGASSAEAAPRLVVGATSVQTAPRAMTVRATLAPARRRVTYHFSYRRPGRAWTRTPRRRVRVPRVRKVTATVRGLKPGRLYAVRLVATTCGGCRAGTSRGRARVFRTTAAPAAPPARAAEPAPSELPPSVPPPAPRPSRTPETLPPEPFIEPSRFPTSPPPGTYRNPVWSLREFPDPMIIRDGSAYYAYATGDRFQVLRSTDLMRWELLNRALSARPAWAVASGDWQPWGPSVLPTTQPCPGATEGGCYLLFYTGLSDKFGSEETNCVAVATSPTPQGPFTDTGPLEQADGTRVGGKPIGCGDATSYGNIDPQPFVDIDGKAWLYVSTDWKCTDRCRVLPEISVIPLTKDRVRAAGARTPLLSGQAGTWEQAPWAPVVENPWVLRRAGIYHLLYSGGNYKDFYGMGHATSLSPTGPFTRSARTPWLVSTEMVDSAGGGAVVGDGDGTDWLAYHGRNQSLTAPRTLRIDRLGWTLDQRPTIEGPSADPRTAPTP